MKKFFVLVMLGFLAINVHAQWYSRSFGADNINDLSEAQLNYSLQRAQANLKAGKIATFSGIGAFTFGTFIAVSGLNGLIFGGVNNGLNRYAAGSLLMLLGMGSTIVGVPLWIAGASRKKKIEIALLRFDSSAFTGYRQPEQMELSLRINF